MENETGKYIWTAKVSNKGQIVIPKEARDVFGISEGDTLILFGDREKGIAIAKYNDYLKFAEAIFRKQEHLQGFQLRFPPGKHHRHRRRNRGGKNNADRYAFHAGETERRQCDDLRV